MRFIRGSERECFPRRGFDTSHPKCREHIAGALRTFTCTRRIGSQGPAARIAFVNPSSVYVHHDPAAQFSLQDFAVQVRKIRQAGMAGHRAQFVQRQLLGETVPASCRSYCSDITESMPRFTPRNGNGITVIFTSIPPALSTAATDARPLKDHAIVVIQGRMFDSDGYFAFRQHRLGERLDLLVLNFQLAHGLKYPRRSLTRRCRSRASCASAAVDQADKP
jgi:hypothetical protein